MGYVLFLVVNSSGVGLPLFYFPQFRKLHWGLYTVYTYGVICRIKFDCNWQQLNLGCKSR